jgi:hypothetical protein
LARRIKSRFSGSPIPIFARMPTFCLQRV